jgi:hypothetical protein
MKRLALALVLASGATLGAPAFAQDMGEALSMLELSAQKELRDYGFSDTDVMSLTLTQLAKIKTISQSSDYGSNEKMRQIERILSH